MAKQKTETLQKQPSKPAQHVNTTSSVFLFTRENYIVMVVGLLLLAMGFLLMAGGNQPTDQFDPTEVYSFRRITLSTIVVTLGFLVVIASIFWKRKPKASQ